MAQTIAPQNLVKQASEKRQYTMNFANLMSTNETISNIDSVTSELRGGGATDLIITNEAISGQTVTMWIEGGTKAHTYRVEVIITTNGSQILEGDGLLKISH
jgi:hypothetical protein